MNILITGAAGMIGRKLTARLVAERALNDKPIDHLKLLDVSLPPRPDEFSTHAEAIGADIADPGTARAAIAGRPDVIFHLAAAIAHALSSPRRSRCSARRFRMRSQTISP